ncbi:MAG: molybdopterin cofactor-binding domain-containing protein [Bryobacteraceae bacterium]
MTIETPVPTAEKTQVSRRGVLGSAGALMIGLVMPGPARREMIAAAAGVSASVNAWVQIASNETVTLFISCAEMGQGIMTGLAQILAEDLMVDWTKVRVVAAPTDAVYNNPAFGMQATGGSSAVAGYYTPLRQSGAAARDMLLAAAAQTWGVTPSQCTVSNGVVTRTGTTQTLTYGQLAALAATMPVPTNPVLTPDNLLRLIGKPIKRVDLPLKVNGKAVYGIDVRVPGMVYAAIKHPPAYGGTVASVASNPNVVNLGNAVAVVADNTWKAIQSARSLSVQWTIPSASSSMTSASILTQAQQLMTSGPALVAETVGDAAGNMGLATKKLDVTYQFPFLAHACMEPLNCTVDLKTDSCTVWAPTQAQTLVQSTASTITGLPISAITVKPTFLGGGLGRKFELDFITQALQIAVAIKKPVKLTWSREEDFSNDWYRPFALVRVQAGLDANNNVVSWIYRNVSESILAQHGYIDHGVEDSQATEGATGLSYNFMSRLVDWVEHPATVPVGFWRSVGNSINAYAVESAIDELALLAGIDPLALRQQLLVNDPRSLAVVNAAAQMANWGTPPASGHARGIAFCNSFGTLVCHVVDVSNPSKYSVRVNNVWTAVDCGRAINPNQVEAQIQGGIIHGMTGALWGQIPINKGMSTVKNFSNYRMARMSDMPKVQVQIINSGQPIGGMGEPGVPPIGPAIAAAYYRLTGTRVRNLPFFPGAPGGGDS